MACSQGQTLLGPAHSRSQLQGMDASKKQWKQGVRWCSATASAAILGGGSGIAASSNVASDVEKGTLAE